MKKYSAEWEKLSVRMGKVAQDSMWIPSTQPKSFALQETEAQARTLLAKVSKGLGATADQFELNRFGNKHVNLLKMDGLVSALGVSDVMIPPAGNCKRPRACILKKNTHCRFLNVGKRSNPLKTQTTAAPSFLHS